MTVIVIRVNDSGDLIVFVETEVLMQVLLVLILLVEVMIKEKLL